MPILGGPGNAMEQSNEDQLVSGARAVTWMGRCVAYPEEMHCRARVPTPNYLTDTCQQRCAEGAGEQRGTRHTQEWCHALCVSAGTMLFKHCEREADYAERQ